MSYLFGILEDRFPHDTAHFRLAGESPFKGTNDFEVLNKTKTCDWEFNEAFASFSEEAKDFIGKLLLKNPR